MLQCLHHLYGSLLDSLQYFLSLLYWGAQNWSHSSRCDHTSAKWRGRITSLDLLAICRVMQLRVPFAFFAARAHCCSCSSWCPRPRGPFMLSCFPAVWPQHILVPGDFPVQVAAQTAGKSTTPPTQSQYCILLFTNTQLRCLTLTILLTDKENKVCCDSDYVVVIKLSLSPHRTAKSNEFC